MRIGDQTCEGLGHSGGQLACSEGCTYDRSGCTSPDTCGDGDIDPPAEQCDGEDLGGASCQSQGFDEGNLSCRGNCSGPVQDNALPGVPIALGAAPVSANVTVIGKEVILKGSCSGTLTIWSCADQTIPAIDVGAGADLTVEGFIYLDDHPRNHAILAKDLRWRLSPAFDLGPSPSVALDRRDLAMACGRSGRYANRTNILSSHGRFLLKEAEAAGGIRKDRKDSAREVAAHDARLMGERARLRSDQDRVRV